MRRRGFIGMAVAVPFAGCGMLGSSDSISTTLREPEDMEDLEAAMSDTFDASAGDEMEVHLEALADGTTVSILPEEASYGTDDMMDGDGQLDTAVWRNLEEGDTVDETVEFEEDDTYVFLLWEGEAEVEAELV